MKFYDLIFKLDTFKYSTLGNFILCAIGNRGIYLKYILYLIYNIENQVNL